VDVKQSAIYKEYLAMREEIDKHKWYESEKRSKDVGFAWALFDWTFRHKSKWLKDRKTKQLKEDRDILLHPGPV